MSQTTDSEHLIHVLLTVMLLNTSSMGRYALAERLHLTKAKTRVILEELVGAGLAQSPGQHSGRGGTTLSPVGLSLVQAINQYFSFDLNGNIRLPETLIGSRTNYIVLVGKNMQVTTTGMYERDIAIRHGAAGAITVIRDDNSNAWMVPPDNKIVDITFENTTGYDLLIAVWADTGHATLAGGALAVHFFEDQIREILKPILSIREN